MRDAEWAIGYEDTRGSASEKRHQIRDVALAALLVATFTVGGLLARRFEIVEFYPGVSCKVGQYGWIDGALKRRHWNTDHWSPWIYVGSDFTIEDLAHQAYSLTFAEADTDPITRWSSNDT